MYVLVKEESSSIKLAEYNDPIRERLETERRIIWSHAWRAPFERSFDCSLEHVSLVTSALTDRILSFLGTGALTVNKRTVWAHSVLSKSSAATFLLTVGHELAHTMQLNYLCNDSTEDLEVDAWQASICALQNRSFRIKARGVGPLAAAGLYMNTSAKDYFEIFG